MRKTDAPGAMRESIPPFHRTGPLAGQPYQPLRVLEAILLPRERKAVAALVGKFPERARAIWQQDTPANRRALEVMKEVDRHYASKNSEQAKALADQVYADKLERFWGGVRKDPVLKGMINEAALVFDEKSEVSAPYWLLPDGTKEVLTIDHMTPRRIDPRKAIDPNNLQFSPARENTFMLEYIRKNQTIDWQ